MSKVAKATIGLMFVTILSKILGFGRELVLASMYGTSAYSDAYLVAMNIPNVLFAAIGAALATTLIPLYYELQKDGEETAIKFINNILNIVVIISIIIAVFCFIYAPSVVKLFAVGFKGETLRLAVIFTRIMIFSIIFIGLNNIMTSLLQIKNNFIIPGLVGIPLNIIIIISIVLSSNIHPYILPIGTLVAIASQFIFQIPWVKKVGYRYEPYINIKDQHIKKVLFLVCPVFLGVAVNQVNAIVDRTLASTLIEGSISALNYADKLNGFVTALFITSIISVIYPKLSKTISENNNKEFVNSIIKSMNIVIILIIPISVGAIVLAEPIVKVLFERGAFDGSAVSMTAIALSCYAIGMIGFGLRDVIGRVFYSLQDTKTPMINGAISMIINVVLNIILVKYLGIAGLAIATSISAIICVLALLISLSKKIGYFGQDKILKVFLKSMFAAIIMGISIVFLYRFISGFGSGFIYEVIILFSCITGGVVIYGFSIWVLKIEEINIITNLIKNRVSKNNR